MVIWCRDQGFGSRQGRSVGGAEVGRDMGLTSRPGLLKLGSRPHFEVATWPRLLGHLVSRLGHCLDTVHGNYS